MSFDLQDYVDVAERERMFFERYPDGRIQVALEDVRDSGGGIIAWKASATIWRTPDDPVPVCDWAVEPVPGKTPYTRDSEAMNASTSAVGRAIVLAGFPSKKIASAQEVLARQAPAGAPSSAPSSPPSASGKGTGDSGASPAEEIVGAARDAQQRQQHPNGEPADDGKPENVVITFGKHKGLPLGQVPEGYLEWLIKNFEARNAEQRRVLAAAHELVVGQPPFPDPADDDIPF